MSAVDTRWGYELWNEYEGILKHVHANIELVELVQKFNQERILIEQSYAQKIKKLVRKYSAARDSGFSGERAVMAYLNEVGNVGQQHERFAANLDASVVKESTVLSGEWRKSHKSHQMEGVRLDKLLRNRTQAFEMTYKKYKDAHQEMLRAQEAYLKADEDRKLSRADVDKAKNNAQAKRQDFDRLKAEYAAQRQDFNAFQRDHYQQQLPGIFKDLEAMDVSILSKLNGFLYKAGVSESTVANDLMHSYEAISKCAEIIDWSTDADLVTVQLRNDQTPPGDRPFIDLDLESPSSSLDNVSNGGGTSGHSASFSGRAPVSSNPLKSSSTKKDRPGRFLRGLFNGSVSGASGMSMRQKDSDDFITSPRPERKMTGPEDIQTAIRRAEKQKAALEKLTAMQEQNQKTCDMEQVEAEMKQIQHLLADLRERQARGDREIRPAGRVSKSRSMPSLHDIRRKARISLRKKKTHVDVNGSPGRPCATSSPRRSAGDGNTIDSDEGWTDDDDEEFGPRESPPPHQHDSVSGPQSFSLSGATEDESGTDFDNGYITPKPHLFSPPVPDQFADKDKSPKGHCKASAASKHNDKAAKVSTTPEKDKRAAGEGDGTTYPFIGAAVALYPFEDREDPAILAMKAEEQFYVLHRDDDWTYVTRVDGSAKGMVPTSYLSLHMY